ncbi:MAG TPA: glycosyltransferase [Anaerolineae bacterium]|nr:glycosyltransferase [Anaerolineae bacterium]HNU03300.1 glycosyltransferase [Anaerolineae bacterium]
MNPPLLSPTTITEALTREAAWAESHGADEGYLGMGLLYYTLTYLLRARTAVCLGSGGGFVPRLMRQAQRDLGLADASRTILVDGNLPAAGWGAPQWLAEDSFFRASFPDVEIVLDLTRTAAEGFFARQAIPIDYLHIDADHSFQGCYDDFLAFRPFLHEGSLVTLHDTSYPGAGVSHVVEYLRTLPDCQVLDIPDIGAGTAVARIGKAADDRLARSAPGDGAIQVARRRPTPPSPPPEKEWAYLESPAFAARYLLASQWVAGCRNVIEIGGARTPIDQFLTGEHDSIVVIDPLISERRQESWRGQPCSVTHLRARFQDLSWTIPPAAGLGLVLLGMDFQGMAEEDWQQLYRLIERAQVTVIEFPLSWEPSAAQFARICANTATRIVLRAGLDLAGNDFGNLENSWPPRTDRVLYVLQPRGVAADRAAPEASGAEATPPQPAASIDEPPAAPAAEPAPAGADLAAQIAAAWQQAAAGDLQAQADWRDEGGRWQWQADGVWAASSGVEWSNLEWQPWRQASAAGPRNFVVEVTVSGKAGAAGLSFGAYKDFLTPLSGTGGAHRLQLEVDGDAGRWAFRVDGQLQGRCWWDAEVRGASDLLAGVLTLKARQVQELRFSDLALRPLVASCQLSVIMTCHRFAQRLRLSLRNWCQVALPPGACEILVVNPESPDGLHEHLAAVAASFPHLRVAELPAPAAISRNKGALINRALTVSSGQWVWLTDADCLFAPESAELVLQQVGDSRQTLFFGQRRHLSTAATQALLAGRLDPVADFAALAAGPGPRPDDNAPWGYTQIAHRSLFSRLRYSERVNHFARSDDMFVEECKRHGLELRQIPGLFCLHLDHPFAWYGAESFL